MQSSNEEDEAQMVDMEDLGQAPEPRGVRPMVATVTHRKRARSPSKQRDDDDLRKSWREVLGPPPPLGNSRVSLLGAHK